MPEAVVAEETFMRLNGALEVAALAVTDHLLLASLLAEVVRLNRP